MIRKNYFLVLVVLVLFSSQACMIFGGGDPRRSDSHEPPVVTAESALPETPEGLLFKILVGGEDNPIRSVAYSPDGALIAAGIGSEVRLYDARDGSLVSGIEKDSSVEDIAFSPDGSLIGAGQVMYGVRISQVADGSLVSQIRMAETSYDYRLAFNPRGGFVATGGGDRVVEIWRLADGGLAAGLEVEDADEITALRYSPDGSLIAAGYWDGMVRLWQSPELILRFVLDTENHLVDSVVISPDNQYLAVSAGHGGCCERDLLLFRIADGSSVSFSMGFDGRVFGVDFSQDGRWMAASSNDGLVRVWQTSGWEQVLTFEHEPGDDGLNWITRLAFSPDGSKLITATWSGELYLWELNP
jgi:WD40 repeat protein